MTHQGKTIHKWAHYFPIYERHFAPWQNRSLVFWEVGVYEGGSLQMWQRYFGPNDVVLDDASHHMKPTWEMFQFLYPRLPRNGVYMVEDMHTSYWAHHGGGLNVEDSFINRSKKLIDELNAEHTKGEL